jgi:protein-L-isoaspartate(D-aspartate) O-methyltransferase
VGRLRRALIAAMLLVPAVPAAAEVGEGAHQDARARMVDAIARMARDTARETGRASFAPTVMAAMGKVPRHRFVPAALAHRAYDNNPLPIGQGQTISQPYIVALSTDLVEPKRTDVVLEVGTGSGYQAAVLAELVQTVYTIEIVEPLGRDAERRLAAMGYDNVVVTIGDGYAGWPEHAPFDAIAVGAGSPEVPQPLRDQLAVGGRLVIPVGRSPRLQDLVRITRLSTSQFTSERLCPVAFVPLIGRDGWGPDAAA